jgi:F-type H+-transporting ATPase subunit a
MFNFAKGPVVHIAPGTDFTIFGIHITNSIILGWIVSVAMVYFLIKITRQVTVLPKSGVIQYVEGIVTFIGDIVENAFQDKRIGIKYVPYFVTLFFIILVNNWSGLIPGVGDAFHIAGHPLLRPMTADLNSTLVMGIITMGLVYVASIKEVGGFRHYIRHFFIGSPLNPLYLIIGIIEMFTDITRLFSLALRLFLNVAIGEIVISVFAYLGTLIFPASILSPVTALPFTLLELGVGALQAYIFVILAVNYLAIAVNSAQDHDDLTEDEVPETISRVPQEAN